MEAVIEAIEQDVRSRACPCCDAPLEDAPVAVQELPHRHLRVGWLCPRCACAHCGVVQVTKEMVEAVQPVVSMVMPKVWEGILYSDPEK